VSTEMPEGYLRVLVVRMLQAEPVDHVYVVYSDLFDWNGSDTRMVGAHSSDQTQCYRCPESTADSTFREFCREWDRREMNGEWVVQAPVPGRPPPSGTLIEANMRWAYDVVGRAIRARNSSPPLDPSELL
jgi:hypothetical protein